MNCVASIPTGNMCVISLGMVKVMEKWFFHAQTRRLLTSGERLNRPLKCLPEGGGLGGCLGNLGWEGASKPL